MGKHRFVIEGESFEVQVHSRRGDEADVTVNGRQYRVKLAEGAVQAERPRPAVVAPARPRPSVATATAGTSELHAPMAGLVLRTPAVGQQVRAGDTLLVLDAMKMENSLAAPRDGVVTEVPVARGESVLRGALLVRLG